MRVRWFLALGGLLAALWLGASGEREAAAETPVVSAPSTRWISSHGAVVLPGPESAAAPIEPAAVRDAELERDLEALVDKWFLEAKRLSKGKLAGAETWISVSVRDGRTGGVLADLRAGRSMRPASNMKLVTTAAAVTLAGPDGRFETRFELSGSTGSGRLDGDLIVRAGGDPVVRDGSAGRIEAFFDPLVAALERAGIRRITGRVVLDEDDFLEPGPGPAWPSAKQRWKDYCAFAAGLTLNGGVLEARVVPGAAGRAATVELHPRPTGLKESLGVATKAGRLNDVRVGATATQVTVKGAIGAKTAPVEAAFRHPDPVALFGAVLEAKLATAGIRIDGGIVRRRGPPAGVPLLVISSPIADCLVPINTYSTNGVADQLFFKLGHDFGGGGTRVGGQAAVEQALARLGVSTEGLLQVDGSGLSRDNRITPAQLSALLQSAILGFDTGRAAALEFKQSLAIMGSTGTLEDRMVGQPAAGFVFAKTGYLDGTSALSGLVVRTDGTPLIFSILVNYPSIGGLNTRAWKPMQEAMVARLFGGPR